VSDIVRFWSKVEKTSDCWLWKAGRLHLRGGYGEVHWNGKTQRAHVVAYVLSIGPVPTGHELDHLCQNTACVRPDHLEPVTRAEHARRTAARRTHCPRGHDREEHSYRRPDGRRECRPCATEKQRERRAA
jgi:hypothetical protein